MCREYSTKGAIVAVSFDGEQRRMVDDASVKTRTVDDNFRFLVRTYVDFKRRFGYLLSSVGDHDDVAAIFARMVHGFGGVLVDFAQFHRFVDSARANDANIQLALTGAFGVDAEIGNVATRTPFGCNPRPEARTRRASETGATRTPYGLLGIGWPAKNTLIE